MTKHKRKLLLDWGKFDEAMLAGATELETHEWVREKTCSGIYGIPRGGLVVAVALSHYLELPLLLYPKRHCIVVDDVVETGKTLEQVRKQARMAGISEGDIIFWSWVTKRQDLISRYHTFIDPAAWIVFPWENWLKSNEDMKDYQERRTGYEGGAYDDVSSEAD